MRYTKAMRDAQLKMMGEIAPLQDELNEMSSKITFRMDEVQVLILYKDDLSTVSRISHVNFRKIADMDNEFKQGLVRSYEQLADIAYDRGYKVGEDGVRRALWALAAPEELRDQYQ